MNPKDIERAIEYLSELCEFSGYLGLNFGVLCFPVIDEREDRLRDRKEERKGRERERNTRRWMRWPTKYHGAEQRLPWKKWKRRERKGSESKKIN